MIERMKEIAREAGKMMLEHRDAAIHQKAGHFNFVTDADVAVQQLVKDRLLAMAPEARFFAEEQENEPLTDAPTFVVDPIDGTLNYMRHRNCSAVSIGYLEGRKPVKAVIYNPFADEMFSAEKGKGAFLNGKPIHVSDTPFENALVIMGTSPYDLELSEQCMRAGREFLRRAGDLRRTGSACVELCDLACGRGDIFFELRLRPWDFAAGALIVTEAGGCFFSLGHEEPWFETPTGVMACNPRCREEAMKILKEQTGN